MDNTPNGNSNPDESLGRAANRYVTFQIVSAIVGGIIFLIVLFTVILPGFNRANQQTPFGMPGSATTTYTVDGHPATPAQRQIIEHQMNTRPVPGSPPR